MFVYCEWESETKSKDLSFHNLYRISCCIPIHFDKWRQNRLPLLDSSGDISLKVMMTRSMTFLVVMNIYSVLYLHTYTQTHRLWIWGCSMANTSFSGLKVVMFCTQPLHPRALLLLSGVHQGCNSKIAEAMWKDVKDLGRLCLFYTMRDSDRHVSPYPSGPH